MEKIFHLIKRGTNINKEIIGGITTFLAMAYILAVNPDILSGVWKRISEVPVVTWILSCVFIANLIFEGLK